MRALIALAVTLVVLIVAEPSATATQPARPPSPVAFTPVILPVGGSGIVESARIAPGPGPSPAPAAVIRDAGTAPVPVAAGRGAQPDVRPQAIAKPTPKPKPRAVASSGGGPARFSGGGHVLRGPASWYCNSDGSRGPISACHHSYPDRGGFDAYAAAGPRLRRALGDWRGRIVSVDGLRVKLVDWCQCYRGQSNEKIIDLYRDVYGVVGGSVTIRW